MIKWHIFLSTLSLLVMIAAGFQAVLLNIQDYYLRKHQINILSFMPSIEKLEKYLFKTIILGWILLLIVFISSLIFFGFSQAPIKILLTLIALSIFSILLLGRYQWGWRGHIAIRWTLSGLILLLLIYCGTGLLLHVSY